MESVIANCSEKCPIYINKKKELLDKCDSVFDAVVDMDSFIVECSKSCKGLLETTNCVAEVCDE